MHVARRPDGASQQVRGFAVGGDEHVDGGRFGAVTQPVAGDRDVHRFRAVVVGEDRPPGTDGVDRGQALGEDRGAPQPPRPAVGRVEKEQLIRQRGEQGSEDGYAGGPLKGPPGQRNGGRHQFSDNRLATRGNKLVQWRFWLSGVAGPGPEYFIAVNSAATGRSISELLGIFVFTFETRRNSNSCETCEKAVRTAPVFDGINALW